MAEAAGMFKELLKLSCTCSLLSGFPSFRKKAREESSN